MNKHYFHLHICHTKFCTNSSHISGLGIKRCLLSTMKGHFRPVLIQIVFLYVDPISYWHSPVPNFRHRAAAQERHKMVAVVSVFAATIFLTAVLLIVITLNMSQNSNSKGKCSQF